MKMEKSNYIDTLNTFLEALGFIPECILVTRLDDNSIIIDYEEPPHSSLKNDNSVFQKMKLEYENEKKKKKYKPFIK